jgi:hypothetical protein
MNSSQMASVVSGAVALVTTLLLMSVQLRVLRRPAGLRPGYAVAWAISTAMLGGLWSYLDTMVGRAGMADRVANVSVAGLVAGLALGAGHLLSRSRWWQRTRRGAQAASLLAVHGAIVWTAGVLAR